MIYSTTKPIMIKVKLFGNNNLKEKLKLTMRKYRAKITYRISRQIYEIRWEIKYRERISLLSKILNQF